MADQQDSSSSSGSQSTAGQVNVQSLKSQISNRLQANKPLVLKLHSVLTWEQDVYPIVVSALVSLSFLIIYLMNSSILTTISIIGIFAAIFDLALPTLSKQFTPGQDKKLTDKDNQRFDKICLDLAKIYAFSMGLCDQCCSLKTKKPKIYYPMLFAGLFISAYIGNKFNNLFLTYLATLFVALYPGLDKKGIPQKAQEFVLAKLPGYRIPSSGAPSGDRRGSGKRN